MNVCLCNALTDRQVKQAAATAGTTKPATSTTPVAAALNAANASRRCWPSCAARIARCRSYKAQTDCRRGGLFEGIAALRFIGRDRSLGYRVLPADGTHCGPHRDTAARRLCACVRALALSTIPGNRRRTSIAADSSPSWSKVSPDCIGISGGDEKHPPKHGDPPHDGKHCPVSSR